MSSQATQSSEPRTPGAWARPARRVLRGTASPLPGQRSTVLPASDWLWPGPSLHLAIGEEGGLLWTGWTAKEG